jgi:hypothetical protein
MKLSLSLILLLFFSANIYATDTIIVRKDERLDIITKNLIQINKRSSLLTSSGKYKGFRIQVISTTSREQAFSIKNDLLNKFPNERSYVMFQSPYFKVRIGNFLKRPDAEKFRKDLSKYFSHPVFVVEDAIDYIPPPEEEDIL